MKQLQAKTLFDRVEKIKDTRIERKKIENQLYWCLDIGFREDESRVREGYSAENLATLRPIGINLLKQETNCKSGIEDKRKKAGWDESYLRSPQNLKRLP